MTTLAITMTKKIARPLKVLVPLIQHDLERGDQAGMEFYADAGDKLLEARESGQVANWDSWVTRNFHIKKTQSSLYMRWARIRRQNQENGRSGQIQEPKSINELTGGTERVRARRHAERPLREALGDLDRELFTQEKQSRTDEIQLHREIAIELVDIGYKALATRLHPDRGGSKDAMARLNRVREELQDVAKTRRFI